jgi:hypothetical protein
MATRRRICRIRVLAENSPFLANSSTRQNGHFGKLAGLDTFADIRQPVLVGLDTFARHSPDIRQPLSPDSIHSRKANLHEFSEFGEFSEYRLDRFIHIKYVICA